MGGPQDVPPRFPCWCRATYSWGGETKRDLGFVEGDLIEALNAGDGLWWMGRLRRDPRAIGVFPSNFVKVLDESFQPAPNSRHASPMVAPNKQASPAKQKSVFRKPFQAYEVVGQRGSMGNDREGTPEAEKERVKREKSKLRPYSSMKTAQAPTGTAHRPGSVSPSKPAENGFRVPSPPPRRTGRPVSRAASPLPAARPSASPTPTPGYGQSHSAAGMSRATSPHPMYQTSRAPSPRPDYRAPSPQPDYRAPSPRPDYRAPSPQPDYRAHSPRPDYRAPSPQPDYRAYSPRPDYRAASPQPDYRSHSPRPDYRAVSPQPDYRARSPRPDYRAHSPAPSRGHSPLPVSFHDGSAFPQLLPQTSRGPSPNPYQQSHHGSRAPSPAPSFGNMQPSRGPSPAPFSSDLGSSPPPPPPVHRVLYQPSRAPSPQPQHFTDDGRDRAGSRTPVPRSPGGGSHMTPSPLRDAMNDVMSSLQDMSMVQSESPERRATTSGVWSPDEFDIVRSNSRQQMRAQSSLGFAHGSFGERVEEPSLPSSRDGPPDLGNFVQRMERQLQHHPSNSEHAPAPPLKGHQGPSSRGQSRPTTSSSQSSHESTTRSQMHSQAKHPGLRSRKSAFELGGRDALNRTYTTKTNVTNSTESSSATQSSTSTQLTSRSIMSGYSAGGFSATSAGSLARRKFGLGSQKGSRRPLSHVDTKSMGDLTSSARSMVASDSSGSGPSYHESHATFNQHVITPVADWTTDPMESAGVFGGLGTPKTSKKSGFFRKMIENAKTTAKTGAANARATVGSVSRPTSRAGGSSSSPTKSMFGSGRETTGFGGGSAPSGSASSTSGGARDMGLGGGNEWMQVRRDVNRSNSLSRREREERAERCEMLDLPSFRPIEALLEHADGDESLDGFAITDPTDFNAPNLALVDKSTRFISSIPPMINPAALAQSYICRPYRSDVQRLRAIFTWVAERITWEEDFEGQPDPRRVIQTKRGFSEEIAMLVQSMCSAVGLHAELVRGYLKLPGEMCDLDAIARGNHWWNAVIVDGEWRIMDAALASPTHPRRSLYSSASSQVAESWYFLARPMEICYTHIPLLPEQQHIVPPVQHEILSGLPCACPTYFRHSLELADFDTSVLHLENLEMAHLHVFVPEDVECVAEIEARALARDSDGDLFESGDVVARPALAQPEWTSGRKRFTIKALLPPDATSSTLKVYAGKRGLMHSVKGNPHALALALPLTHAPGGANPAYDFLVRHPTPHAQRHDLYVAQPQCARLGLNNTFVFAVRQHPSALSRFTPDTWGGSASSAAGGGGGGGGGGGMRPTSPAPGTPYARPSSAMSMLSTSASIVQSVAGSGYSDAASSAGMTSAQLKPAKLAIQSPSQKIVRLTRKMDGRGGGGASAGPLEEADGGLASVWETVIKVGERGTWRGLVLADRSARWCVFAEWECV